MKRRFTSAYKMSSKLVVSVEFLGIEKMDCSDTSVSRVKDRHRCQNDNIRAIVFMRARGNGLEEF
jgi:hypothetical protein